MKRTLSVEQLAEELQDIEEAWFDGKVRLVEDSDNVLADGCTWGIVSDHGNVSLVHKGRNGHIYYHGGLV